jgi:hypothetical protein
MICAVCFAVWIGFSHKTIVQVPKHKWSAYLAMMNRVARTEKNLVSGKGCALFVVWLVCVLKSWDSFTRYGSASTVVVSSSKGLWGKMIRYVFWDIDLMRNPRDDLFSDDFGIKINKVVCNLAHIFVLRRPLIILFKNIVYLEGILHFRRWKLGVNHPTIGISQRGYASYAPFMRYTTISQLCAVIALESHKCSLFLYQRVCYV